jgi:DNA modification methylase
VEDVRMESKGARTADNFLRHDLGTLFRFQRDQADTHPTMKPVAMVRDILSAVPGDVVLDPFVGSGTTLRAAKDLGRRAIGIEIEEKHCEIAANRLRQEVLF